MTVHLSCHKRLLANRKGYSAIIATIIMVLVILYFYFNVMMFSLDRDADLQDVTNRSAQLDVDRMAEKVTISNVTITQGALTGQLVVTCTLINTGTVPIQMARLWLEDKTLPQNNVGNVALTTPPVLLQPGSRIQQTFPPVIIQGSSTSDSFYLWLVTFRGNSFSQIAN